jgi:hypothetical protein
VVVQPAQPPASVPLHLVVHHVELGLALDQLIPKPFHAMNERFDVGLAKQPHSCLNVGQRQAAPVVDQASPDGREPTKSFMARVDDLLSRCQEAGIGVVGDADFLLLLGGQALMRAPPVQTDARSGGRASQSLGWAVMVEGDVGNGDGANGVPFCWKPVWKENRARQTRTACQARPRVDETCQLLLGPPRLRRRPAEIVASPFRW